MTYIIVAKYKLYVRLIFPFIPNENVEYRITWLYKVENKRRDYKIKTFYFPIFFWSHGKGVKKSLFLREIKSPNTGMLFQLSNGTSYSQTGGEPVFYFAIINLKEVRAFKHPNVLWYWVKTFSKRSVKLSLRRWRFLCALDENEGDGDAKTSGGAGSGVVSQFSLPHSSRRSLFFRMLFCFLTRKMALCKFPRFCYEGQLHAFRHIL